MGRPKTPLGAHGVISVRRRENRGRATFEARAWVRDLDGVARAVSRRGETAASARRALQEALVGREAPDSGEIRRSDALSALVARYLELQRGKGLAASSLAAYERVCDRMILPRIGALTVAEATTARLDAFLRLVAKEHGAASAKSARSVLSGVMGVAVRYGLVASNPVRDVSPIRQKVGGAAAIEAAKLRALREAVAGDDRLRELDMPDLVDFMIGTGCRIGEACGLRWDRVDLVRGEVTIAATVVRLTGEGLRVQDNTKTGRERVLALPLWVQEMLLRRQVEMPGNAEQLVFPTVLGNVRDPSNTNRVWREAMERLGLGRVTFHAFRKSVATLLDGAGLSARDIADQLGHAHASMTQDVYMARRTTTKRAANELERIVRDVVA